ncbi:MAG TPA: hypothetical protein PKI61_00715 [bacterium]|nr:hypothetical protein [bacterium]HPT29406.1 hypothetical protein [bacterium]
MKKIIVFVAAIFAFGLVQAQESSFLELLKTNQKKIAKAHASKQQVTLTSGYCLEPMDTKVKSTYLFLACSNQGLEIMFTFTCHKYIAAEYDNIPDLVSVYLCGPDPNQPTRVFYSSREEKGLFLFEDPQNGTLEIPVLQGTFSRMNDPQRDGFIKTIRELITALI